MLDYEELGFKCGLELHQQLSGKKLFCNCNTELKEGNIVFTIKRKIKPVVGETGEYDIASEFESARDRTFIYQGYEGESCLVDVDCEPPKKMNKDALHTALSVAKFFKLRIPDTILVMRKTVSDGSAPSAFQRTMITGLEAKDSKIETSLGDVKIIQLNLEEDACKKIDETDNVVTYSLSRVGIPLLELATGPQIKTPEHALEVAKQLGMIFRSFPLVKRGLGTIRQDINVSIKEGTRIEIKGWQDLRTLPILIENEVERQKFLVNFKKFLNNREINTKPEDVSYLFKQTRSKIIYNLLKENGKVYALVLPHFAGWFKKEVCKGKTFGREISEYAKAHGTKGMIHSDEDLSKYDLTQEFVKLREHMKAGNDDLIVLVAEKEKMAVNAINAVLERAKYCLKGVPEETRVPNHFNATSSFARPLPGSNRMYPETDQESIKVNNGLMDEIYIPELISERAVRFEKQYNLNPDIARQIAKEYYEFEELTKGYKNVEPKLIAEILLNIPKDMKKRLNLDINKLTYDNYCELFSYLNQNKITKTAIVDVLTDMIKGEKINVTKYQNVSETLIENAIKEIVATNKGAPFNAVMGMIMDKYRGKVDGSRVAEIIRKNL
ncbi:Glu-tRNA(Gln) amidotransferase subunit GatE [Candidatus Woesearchaeota archaeon]|nr:Glu-tRNA(Gln) amidotransferase subunit GatE [Candidatus Woesearchaeota archaeon]